MTMKFEKPTCPNCNGSAANILEEVLVSAYLDANDDGSYEYSGGTDVHWECQKPLSDENNCVKLRCGECDETWWTKCE